MSERAGEDPIRIERTGDLFAARFTAMASPCEVLLDTDVRAEAFALAGRARREALRIERKFSRYRTDSVVGRIHAARGRPVSVDDETAALLDLATLCHQLSQGRFDITSGVLRRAWVFDGGEHVPSPERIAEALVHVGWDKASWRRPVFTLPEGMEIDFGGLGKEYAVDGAAALLAAASRRAFLVNFGGDLFASGPRRDGEPWAVGVDDPEATGERVLYRVDLARGGLATSGDARRFVRWQGRRLGHLLDPRTGWPPRAARRRHPPRTPCRARRSRSPCPRAA